ncbi:MAG: AHH domain-containing protein [Gemmatimonadaceae bacterium]|nr:AHH domain-containing protein [Gemmatimonadaceae bacterium]
MTSHASVQGLKRTMYYERSKPNPVNYANNCTGKTNWQKHHILPCTSVKRSIKAAEATKPHLEKALKYFTTWNINDADNLMPMPTRKAFQKAYGKKGGKQGVISTLTNLPCHQPTNWGHTIYNEKVYAKLIDVWQNVSIKIQNHKLDSNDVSSDISDLRDVWKDKLETGRDGSIANWRAMIKGVSRAHNNFTMVKMASSPI